MSNADCRALELVDAKGPPIDDAELQLARLADGPGLRLVE